MNDKQINIAIAEACGWKDISHRKFMTPLGNKPTGPNSYTVDQPVPRYTTDLNAMHEAEKMLDDPQTEEFVNNLCRILDFTTNEPWQDYDVFQVVHTTARQRAEAFLKTLNLWKD